MHPMSDGQEDDKNDSAAQTTCMCRELRDA
jgi:hypothetical protein